MKSLPKLIRRCVGIMLFSSILLIALNIALLAAYTLHQMPNAHPWTTAAQVADGLIQDGDKYILSEDLALELKRANVWGIFIDNRTLQVVWKTEDLPTTVPMAYSISDIAHLTRGLGRFPQLYLFGRKIGRAHV